MDTPTHLHEAPQTIGAADLDRLQEMIEPAVQPQSATYSEVLHATRLWVLYGCGGFAIFCILIGAAEALLGR